MPSGEQDNTIGQPETGPPYRIGDIANGHLWTGAHWVPVEELQNPEYARPPAPGSFPQVPNLYSSAITTFLIGCAIAIGVSLMGIGQVNSGHGGIIWLGGYFVALGFWRSAWRKYKDITAHTLQRLSSGNMLVIGAALLLTLGSAGYFGFAKASTGSLRETVGSCWRDEGTMVVLVPCSSSEATYRGVEIATNEQYCPQSSDSYVKLEASSTVLCLAPK